MRYYLFLDESGDHGLKTIDEHFPVFVLSGLIISENEYIILRDKINEIKLNLWGDKKVILHSRDIRKCQNEFQILFDLTLKEEFYRRINECIRDTNYSVVSSAIKKVDFIKKYGKQTDNVYEIALSFVMERSVFYLDELNKKIDLQIVIEKRGKREDQKLERHFQRIRSSGTYFVDPDRFKSYGFGFHFRNKSDNVNGLQIADLIAYPIARYVLDPNRANPSFDSFKSKIYGHEKMFGLKIFP